MKAKNVMPPILLGTQKPLRGENNREATAGGFSGPSGAPNVVRSEASELRCHLGRPWLAAWLAEHAGIVLPAHGADEDANPAVTIDESLLARHALSVGGSGGGKTRFSLHLIMAQLRMGHSVIVLDPKAESLRHLAEGARRAGVPPGRMVIITPSMEEGGMPTSIPGWNPLLADIPLGQIVSDFVAVLAQTTTSWGPRMGDILTNTLIVVAVHRLSLFEVVRFLVFDEYREALLGQPAEPQDKATFAEAVSFFTEEFARWSKSERAGAIGPVTNKLREFVRSGFLRALLCAERQTLPLSRFWQEQGVLLVHLDRTALGDGGARLLGGLLTALVFRTAVRCGTNAPVPVVLCLDELFSLQRFSGGGTLEEVLAIARSYRLRLLAACQHLDQLDESLRKSLLANTALQVFFRLGYEDARLVAAALAAGAAEQITRVSLSVSSGGPRTGLCVRTSRSHTLTDARGRPLQAAPWAWKMLRWDGMLTPATATLAALDRFAAASGAGRLYVISPDTGRPVALSRYLRGVPASEWWLTGPAPLRLVVSFPKPKVESVQRRTESDIRQQITHDLQNLEVQHALLRVAGKPPTVFRVVDGPAPAGLTPELAAYLASAVQANSQTGGEIAAVQQARVTAVHALMAGSVPTGAGPKPTGNPQRWLHGEEGKYDGSIA